MRKLLILILVMAMTAFPVNSVHAMNISSRYLSELEVEVEDDEVISPTFSPSTTHYTLDTYDDEAKLTLEAKDDDALIEVNGDEYEKSMTLALDLGDNLFYIKVWDVDEDDEAKEVVKTYFLTIERRSPLRDIIIEDVDFDFDPDVENYRVCVDEDLDDVEVSYNLRSIAEDAEVWINSKLTTSDASLKVELDEDTTNIQVKVLYEGVKTIYTIGLVKSDYCIEDLSYYWQFRAGMRWGAQSPVELFFMYQRMMMNKNNQMNTSPNNGSQNNGSNQTSNKAANKENDGGGGQNTDNGQQQEKNSGGN